MPDLSTAKPQSTAGCCLSVSTMRLLGARRLD
jgi:hypothetical protein